MRRTLVVCAGALLLAAPAAAHEKHDKHAKVSKAKLEAAEESTAVRGRAQLVDARRHDHVHVHMKGLEPGETYLWEVRDGACDDAAAAASEGWTYRELKVRPSGNANAKGRSKDFGSGDDGTSVAVTLEDGTVVACGDFERKRSGRHHGDDDDRSKGHGRGQHRSHKP
jgi:hypothetical protein